MASLSFTVLRTRDFRLLLLTRLLGTMAMQAQAVIVGWQVYSLTHNPFMLGLTGLTEALPAIMCAFFAGHIVDSHRPHRVFIICVSILALNMFLLLLVAGGMISLPNHAVLLWIFGSVFISGLSRSFIMPASFALLPQVVPRAQISAAAAWLSGFFQTAAVAGPALAGIIYGGYGVRAAWMLPVSLMSAEVLVLALMGRDKRSYRNVRAKEPTLQSIRAGWRFIFTHRVLLSVMLLDMFAVLFGGAVAMLPAYADQVLHTGSQGLGALRAAPALGAVVTALMLAVRPFRRIRASMLLWAIAGFGASIIGFGFSQSFWLSMVLLAVSGAFDSVSMVIRGTLVQWLTPDAMRGRVSAVSSMFIISSNEIGAFESGAAAAWLGLMPSIVAGGVGAVLVVVMMALISPKLRRLVVEADPVA